MENIMFKNPMDVQFDEMTALLDFDVQEYITSLQPRAVVEAVEISEKINEVSNFWDQVFIDLN